MFSAAFVASFSLFLIAFLTAPPPEFAIIAAICSLLFSELKTSSQIIAISNSIFSTILRKQRDL